MLAKSRLGKMLIEKEIVDQETFEKALMIQAGEDSPNPRRLEEILVSELNVNHDSVFGSLAELYAFRSIKIDAEKIDDNQIKHTRDILSKFPEEFRKELIYKRFLPYQIIYGRRNTLLVLSANPTDGSGERIPLLTEFKKYEVVYTPLKTIVELIEIVFPQENEFLDLLSEIGAQVEEVKEEEKKAGIDEYALDEEINKGLLVNLYEGCLVEAVRKKASDIHIIPFQRSNIDIYFRIDGKLHLWHRQENIAPESMSAVAKDRTSSIDRFERDTAQDGFAQRIVDGYLIRFRVSVLPIISQEFERRFESIVIRVVDDRKIITDLKKLGFQKQAEKDFLKAINTPKGIVLLTGPTGSGKSTTLMAALYHIIDPSKNVLTCEDPVEYVIKGARQLKIGHKLSFENAVRSILRHDPDIVMVGEIRDKITADVAVKLANTGHLTFSTLHTNDAPSAISRLYKMGVEPFLLAYAINIIVAQRLVRKICPHCREPLSKEKYKAALDLGLTEEDLKSGKIFEAGEGCKNCTEGYKGRINICEALYFSPEIKKAIVEAGTGIDEEKVRQIAEKQGMLSLRESGLERIREGLTTISEVAFATSED